MTPQEGDGISYTLDVPDGIDVGELRGLTNWVNTLEEEELLAFIGDGGVLNHLAMAAEAYLQQHSHTSIEDAEIAVALGWRPWGDA